MKIRIDCDAGRLAADPESALSALVELATTDGADAHEWLEKALKSQGGTQLAVNVRQDPRYQVVEDGVFEALEVYDRVLTLMRSALLERLNKAMADLDIEEIRHLVDPGE